MLTFDQVFSTTSGLAYTAPASAGASPQQVWSAVSVMLTFAQAYSSGLAYTAPAPASSASSGASPQQVWSTLLVMLTFAQGFSTTRTVPTFATLPEGVRQITWTQAFENIASVLLEEQPFDPLRDPFFIVADRPSIGGASSLRSSLANAKAEAVKQQRLLAELVVKMFAANTRARSLASNLQRYENKLVQYEAALKVEKKTVFEEKSARKRRRQEGALATVVGGTF